MNGSWAGAMGHTQFIPTTYSAYAVDQDGDGKRDIWGNIPDALASTASYLKVSDWRAGETWGYEVALPKGFDPKSVNENTLKSLGEWQKVGIVRVNGEAYPRLTDKASLFAPEGTRGPSFLVLNNFRSILRYNVAKSYALAVGHLADRIRGGGHFVHPWPTDETHLSLEQRTEFQRLLIAQGLMTGEPDGVIGPATLEAVKTYQRSKGLGVDGYPSLHCSRCWSANRRLRLPRKRRPVMRARDSPPISAPRSKPARQKSSHNNDPGDLAFRPEGTTSVPERGELRADPGGSGRVMFRSASWIGSSCRAGRSLGAGVGAAVMLATAHHLAVAGARAAGNASRAAQLYQSFSQRRPLPRCGARRFARRRLMAGPLSRLRG